ncbi:hypothetical protein PRUB_a3549 [Pseudoalteromonas rubra]|uniref:Uncharacterized protein n=1 Tax=Pseudoalteromonas rubra TaxID=43658 RepID=A0A8T0C3T8_9GAMM|nr:hypothetical protein PRUB_a3549 [Pseudoalteromonas rubra]
MLSSKRIVFIILPGINASEVNKWRLQVLCVFPLLIQPRCSLQIA